MSQEDQVHDQGGPLVALCAGHRCSALWHLGDESAPAGDPGEVRRSQRLGQTIRNTPGGVLIKTGCLGVCHQGPVVGVAYRAAGSSRVRFRHTFATADRMPVLRGLVTWIASIRDSSDCRSIPEALQPALITARQSR
ncbi:hypothetical protein [Gordonia polyisoprenivorans]|uniref:hypothetical protein n=1 Tax=Gordonia polyisoprenivorans TaxID=84595 RepID=UPI001AD77254|nr:hypothetical protein [Gordonia polyisoprenivorans]QTI67256.1 hypothetical protein J6U32_16700 [Gordonia polyisoprenivorans]